MSLIFNTFLHRISKKKIVVCFVALFALIQLRYVANAQLIDIGVFKFEKKNQKVATIPFRLVHNLIVFPLKINDSDTLNFILDTGVTTTLIVSLPNREKVTLNHTREMELNGLGEGGSVKALLSAGNYIEMEGLKGINHDVLYLLEDIFELSSSMGVFVHGIIGEDLFRNFVVEIDYYRRKMKLYNRSYYYRKKSKKNYRKKKNTVIPFELEKGKPYIRSDVTLEGGDTLRAKLVVDSGASHAISLYDLSHPRITIPKNVVHSYLGSGLSGDIYGAIGRATAFQLGKYNFNSPIVTFPDEAGIRRVLSYSDRNGSLGSEILRRFTVTFDYSRKEMTLAPNQDFKEAFNYNMSGIEVVTPIPGLPIYQISKVRNNSPAMKAGLASGDQIVMINGVETASYTLNDILEILQSRSGKKIRLFVQRYNQLYKAEFVLRDNI